MSPNNKQTNNQQKSAKLPHYCKYIKIDNYFFCLRQSPAVLAWVLFLRRADLHSICTPWTIKEKHRGIVNCFRRSYRFFVSNLNILISFILRKYNFRSIDQVVELPVYGHICLHVHKGYKIFNLRKRTVIKLFDSNVNRDSILDEIERLQTVSCIDFAPSLGKWNIDEKWYEEEYILEYPPSSYKSQDAKTLIKNIDRDIIPCLYQLMLFKQTKSINSLDYVSKLISILEVYESSQKEHNKKEIAEVRDFIKSISEKIQSYGNTDIYLIFSHGDFCPANIMDTKQGIRILDWESAEYRSSLFDYYSYFFYLPVCIYHPLDNLVPTIHETLSDFISNSALNNSNIQNNFSTNGHIYRWIFYIEFICKLVEREITDKNLDVMDFIIRYIGAFNHYEDLLTSNSKSNTGNMIEQVKK